MKKIVLIIVLSSLNILGYSQVGIDTDNPTETFHVNGEVRIQNLPENGEQNAIYTTPAGERSNTKNQTFNGTRTVVVNDNGVLGTLTGVSPISKTSCYNSTTTNFSELADNEGVARVDMDRFSFEWRPGTTASDIGGSNYIYVLNNTTTTYYGKSKGTRDRGPYFTLPPNEWRRMSNNINYDIEESGEMIFFTDVDNVETVNAENNFYNIEYYTEKRTSDSYPSACFNVTRLK